MESKEADITMHIQPDSQETQYSDSDSRLDSPIADCDLKKLRPDPLSIAKPPTV